MIAIKRFIPELSRFDVRMSVIHEDVQVLHALQESSSPNPDVYC